MSKVHRRRRVTVLVILGLLSATALFFQSQIHDDAPAPDVVVVSESSDQPLASSELENLPVRDRAPKDGYKRSEFGNGWAKWGKCDTRQRILARDLVDVKLDDDDDCTVLSGILHDPYTGEDIDFLRGKDTSSAVQIDHVVALSNAWQTGAQDLDRDARIQLANDDLELLAVEGRANQQKGDGDAATWLPENKAFRCTYVARQIAIKIKYELWVTATEHAAISNVLKSCPDQRLPAP